MSQIPSILERLRRGEKPLIECYGGIVDSTDSGAAFGPASGYAYNVWVNFPSGAVLVNSLVPVQERWDDEQDVNPILPGTFVLVASVQGQLQLYARELPHTEPCVPSARGTSLAMAVLEGVMGMDADQKDALRRALEAK